MHEPVDRLELTIGWNVEADHHPVYRTCGEARAHEMTRTDIEPVGDAIRERARRSPQSSEDGDLGGADHSSGSSVRCGDLCRPERPLKARNAAVALPPSR